jgi:hypothetical protein
VLVDLTLTVHNRLFVCVQSFVIVELCLCIGSLQITFIAFLVFLAHLLAFVVLGEPLVDVKVVIEVGRWSTISHCERIVNVGQVSTDSYLVLLVVLVYVRYVLSHLDQGNALLFKQVPPIEALFVLLGIELLVDCWLNRLLRRVGCLSVAVNLSIGIGVTIGHHLC